LSKELDIGEVPGCYTFLSTAAACFRLFKGLCIHYLLGKMLRSLPVEAHSAGARGLILLYTARQTFNGLMFLSEERVDLEDLDIHDVAFLSLAVHSVFSSSFQTMRGRMISTWES
jgi:hypothetical protein